MNALNTFDYVVITYNILDIILKYILIILQLCDLHIYIYVYADLFLNLTNNYLVVDIVKMLVLFVGYIATRILAVHFLL